MARLYSFKCNMAATAAPAVTDDVDLDYVVGSRWFDVTNDKEYVCLDNADGAAVWTETTQSGGTGDVTAAANLTANALIVGDDGAKGIKALALGAANLKLFINAAGTANEYASGMKIGTFSIDTATASGDQAISGVGFKPSHLEFLGAVVGTSESCIGFSDGTLNYCLGNSHAQAADTWTSYSNSAIVLVQDTGINYQGDVSALGADGFTITWTKTGAKTGTVTMFYRAYR